MLWIKSLHIIFIASWFAVLLYFPRILSNVRIETNLNAHHHLLT